MTYLTASTAPLSRLPDPDTQPEAYADTPSKRFFAWMIDVVLIGSITLVLTVFSLFTAVLVWPALFAVVSFLYRWTSIARHSATPGMRAMAVTLRDREGRRLDGGGAFLHTAGYFVSVAVFPLQLISIAAMLMTDRRQGLTDMVLGTAALNRRSL